MSSLAAWGNLPREDITKVYCSCGRIVDLDRKVIDLKLSLGKQVECMRCRNNRISEEIDYLERHFSGVSDEDDWW